MSYPYSFDEPTLWSPKWDNVEMKGSNRIRKTQFGDGYQERRLDGFNSYKREWTITFTLTSIAAAKYFQDICQYTGAGFAYWTDPMTYYTEGGYVPSRWTVDDWVVTFMTPNYAEATVTFKPYFARSV